MRPPSRPVERPGTGRRMDPTKPTWTGSLVHDASSPSTAKGEPEIPRLQPWGSLTAIDGGRRRGSPPRPVRASARGGAAVAAAAGAAAGGGRMQVAGGAAATSALWARRYAAGGGGCQYCGAEVAGTIYTCGGGGGGGACIRMVIRVVCPRATSRSPSRARQRSISQGQLDGHDSAPRAGRGIGRRHRLRYGIGRRRGLWGRILRPGRRRAGRDQDRRRETSCSSSHVHLSPYQLARFTRLSRA